MLVSRANFSQVLREIDNYRCLGVDTEGTGLHFWKDVLFSIIISTERADYYFNFSTTEEKYKDHTLDRSHFLDLITFFAEPARDLYIANAKYDMHMLFNEGIELAGNVICLSARERVIRNDHFPAETEYALDAMGKRYLGQGKSEVVEEYIMKNKLFTRVNIPGKKKEVKRLHFDKVPLEIVHPYGELDGSLHRRVGKAQSNKLDELDIEYPRSKIYGSIKDVARNEMRLTKTCFRMEREGIKVDVDYTNRAMAFEQDLLAKKKIDFQGLTGLEYADSNKLLVQAFERLGLTYPMTEKGNPSFKAEVLDGIENPVANIIKDIRHFEKRIGTYYSSFLYYRDGSDFVHPTIWQGGTEHGRMSYSDPNLQNVPKEDDEEDLVKPFLVRSCFVPDSDEFCFVAIDWKAQEFRMMLDYAGEHNLIEAINNGADPHQATADETGLSRRQSKVINFGIAYGMGDEKLAKALGVTPPEATEMKAKYFRKLRGVRTLIKKVGSVAKTRGYIRNWYGRVCHLKDPEYSYVMFNHMISGGCADVCKIAMNKADDMLMKTTSKLLVQVHDELLFKVHASELDIVPALSKMMDEIYKPQNGMLMTTSTEHSWKSWGKRDLIKGEPCLNSKEQKTATSKTSQLETPITSM